MFTIEIEKGKGKKGKSDGMTKTLARATRKRTGDDEFRTQLDVLDQVMAKVEMQGWTIVAEWRAFYE